MLKINSGEKHFEIEEKNGEIFIDNELFEWDIQHIDGNHYHAIYNHHSYSLELAKTTEEGKEYQIKINGKMIDFGVKDKMTLLLEKMGISAANTQKINELKAPMPGLVLNILVKEGQQVAKGDALMILEAMKMENVLKAMGDGVVAKIKVNQGDNVEKNSQLLTFE